MAKWLNTLRKKPRHVRDNIAFGVSLGFAAVVCVVWFVGGNTGVVASDSGPHFFKTFSDAFSRQLATVKQSVPKKPDVATSSTKEQMQVSAPAPITSTSTNGSSSESTPRQVMIVTTSASTTNSATTTSQR